MDNRRSFMVYLAGFFGLGAVTPVVAAVPKLEGFIVFFINVGSLPPSKAEAFVDRLKEQWKKGEKNSLVANWQIIWIPSRTQETHTEFYPVSGKMDAQGRLEQIEGFLLEYEDTAAHPGAAVDITNPALKQGWAEKLEEIGQRN